jgi:hypothetical protein
MTFIRYVQNRKLGKPNNLKFWEVPQKKTFLKKKPKKLLSDKGDLVTFADFGY